MGSNAAGSARLFPDARYAQLAVMDIDVYFSIEKNQH